MLNSQDCLFCKIATGKIPSHIIYEDEKYLCFLDIRPHTVGDSLLIPKKHYVWTYDVPDFGEYWETARKITQLMMEKLNADWVNYFTYGHIQHAHIHILPRYKSIYDASNKDVIPPEMEVTQEELKAISERFQG